MRVVATGSKRSAILSKTKRRFVIEKSVHVEAIGIQICRQIIGRTEKDGGRKSGIGANLKQTLDNFKRREHSHRVTVCCHR